MFRSSHSDSSAPRGRRARLAGATLLATLGAFAAPAVASATDRWVDAETGSNAGGNDCTVQATPCATIMQASNSSQSTGTFGTIHVDQGTYAESVTIAQANVLAADDLVGTDGGPFYYFYSGFGAALSSITIFGGLLTFWRHEKCQVEGCHQPGKVEIDGWTVCPGHHPDGPLTQENLRRLRG